MKNDSVIIFFGEYAFYSNDDEEKEAKNYLEYWKKNLLYKLHKECYEAVLLNESYHIRPPELVACLAIRTQIALKLEVRLKFKFEFDSCLGIYYEERK